jgi:hypothetical protein
VPSFELPKSISVVPEFGSTFEMFMLGIRTEAQALIAEDETLSQWPEVKRRAESKETTEVHFE